MRIDALPPSAMGETPRSLAGGTLLVTPLLGADGNVYAVAQGSLSIGGFQAQGQAASITRGVLTVGQLLQNGVYHHRTWARSNSRSPRTGQLRDRAAQPRFHHGQSRIAVAINGDYMGMPVAQPLDPSTVQLTLPKKFPSRTSSKC